MTATMEIPFALGEELWSTGRGARQTWITCPECAGTKVIEMIKGNGERVSLDCNECSPGYDPPRGVVQRTIYEHQPTKFVPRRMGMSGSDFTYSEADPAATSYNYTYAKDLYRSYDECNAACIELNAERASAEEQRCLAVIKANRRSLSHSASYWTAQARKLREDLARVEARISRCKASPPASATG